MNATHNHQRQAIANLFSCLAAIRELETIDVDNVPTHAIRSACKMACYAFTADENPWEAIEATARLLRRIDPQPGPAIHGEPPARAHWLRQAWLELLRAAAAAAGHGDDDAPRWQRMTAGELADELTYLADYQG